MAYIWASDEDDDFAKSKAYLAALNECSEPSIATNILENKGVLVDGALGGGFCDILQISLFEI